MAADGSKRRRERAGKAGRETRHGGGDSALEISRLRERISELEKTVERQSEFAELLKRTTTAANSAASIDGALDEIVPDLCRHISAGYGQVWLIEGEETQHFVPRGPTFRAEADRRGPDLAEAIADHWPDFGQEVMTEVFEQGRVFRSDDLAAALGRDRAATAREAGFDSTILVPIPVGDSIEGVLKILLNSTLERPPSTDEVVLGVGAAIGLAVDRIGMQKKLSDLSDDEQRRLGQELHDTVAQEIAGIRMLAEALRRQVSEGTEVAEAAAELAQAAERAQGHVRSLARGLVPATIAAGGLRSAIENLTERTQVERGVVCEFYNPDGLVIDESRLATSLYYIVQEAVLNAVQHGEAGRVRVELEGSERNLKLLIIDDGSGFQVEDRKGVGGSGLRIMRYRAQQIGASLDISSQPGEGTTVRVDLERRRGGRRRGPVWRLEK